MEPPTLDKLTVPTIFFFIALIARAIFSFLETSITALRLFKLKELAETTRYKTLLQTLEKSPHRVLITILIANSFADVTTAALATQIAESVFAHFNLSSSLGFTFGIATASIAIVIFGEILPKNFAKGHGERIFKSLLWLINGIFYLLSPLATMLTQFSNAIICKVVGKEAYEKGNAWITSEQEVRFLIDYIHEKGMLEFEKTEMLQNIFELGRTPIKEIMVPTTDIISIDVNNTINDTLAIFVKHRFTRLPVYRDNPDNIIGMVHQKDIFYLLSKQIDQPLADIVRPILFVPESMKVNQLLREFRQKHMHIAIVLNEHGIVTGLITLEDLLEEIVGEISDEHEPTAEKIIPLKNNGGWLVEASSTLEDLEELLNITFASEDSVTLGGFLTEQLQHLPKKGERIFYKDHYFQIQKASPKRVLQVLIFKKKNNQNNNK